MNKEIKSSGARLGGLRRIELYGNPGTAVGRSAGGRKSIRLFHTNKALANRKGFILRKEIKYPKKSHELAELFGILLGDGCIPGNHQITVTFDSRYDQRYALYIGNLFKKLFGLDYFIFNRKDSNGGVLLVNSSNLVDFLVKQGLKSGNKVKNQVEVPGWIRNRSEYSISCLRGLMDTDGGIYTHSYYSSGKRYKYLKICFTNYSNPLLNFVFGTLRNLNYKTYLIGRHVSIYSVSEVKRYYTEIGFNNPKHRIKFNKFRTNKFTWRDAGVAERSRLLSD